MWNSVVVLSRLVFFFFFFLFLNRGLMQMKNLSHREKFHGQCPAGKYNSKRMNALHLHCITDKATISQASSIVFIYLFSPFKKKKIILTVQIEYTTIRLLLHTWSHQLLVVIWQDTGMHRDNTEKFNFLTIWQTWLEHWCRLYRPILGLPFCFRVKTALLVTIVLLDVQHGLK